MSARTIDVLIFVLLIPAIPVVAFWTLPWERWIAKVPNTIIGPYLLYCAFAIWHFKQSWWIVMWVGSLGIAVSAWAIVDLKTARSLKQARERKVRMLAQAQGWPVAEGFVLHTGQCPDENGAPKVTFRYMYKVGDQECFGTDSATFASRDDAERFEFRCREGKIKVHYHYDRPEICVLDRDTMR